MTQDPAIWLQNAVPHPNPRQRLICFAHAGGPASFFRDWGNHMPDTEVLAVRYPGRGERIEEPSPECLHQLGYDIADAVAQLGDLPIALFGHSMGAVVALETARALEERGIHVAHLFASGSRNAPLPGPEEFADDDDDAVAARLVGLGGTDPELAEDPFFQELVLPYILSDGRMFHAYDNRTGPLLHCPITTIVGDNDPDADLRPWPELTDGGFQEHVLPGDHFYLVPYPPYALLQDSLSVAVR
jgi:surfactin synthase thioesterase subunit